MHATRDVTWTCRGRAMSLGRPTGVMGILNCTPDSFSDGGAYHDHESAVNRGLEMAEEGALIVDVGGESTRPGATGVSAEEECRRVLPVIEELAGRGVALSIDTSKARVAEAALAAGAVIINDVTAGRGDEHMLPLAAESGAGLVLMHMQGTPRTMQENPSYHDVVDEVARFLEERVEAALAAGCRPGQLCLDPGIGFGKTLEHNLDLLRRVDGLRPQGRPLLVGASRKRFIGSVTGREVGDRLAGSIAVATFLGLAGVELIRVHDVKESCDAVRMAAMLSRDERPSELA